ncbi:MAG: class I adenylate-forming enzyme family protein [Sphingobium sp.]
MIHTSQEPAIEHLTFARGVRASCQRSPNKVAIRSDSGELRYNQLVSRFSKIGAYAAAGLGMEIGDRAAILAPNCAEYIEVALGLGERGFALATLNHRLSAREVAEILDDCTPSVLFVHPRVSETAAAALELMETPRPRIVTFGSQYEALLQDASDARPSVRIPEWTTFSIPYTSGTTGKPKGVMLPHRSRVLTALALASEFDCYGPDDDFLALTPLAHGAGFLYPLASIFLGGSCTLKADFDPEETVAAMASGQPTGVFLVPTQFHKMFALPERMLDGFRGKGRLKSILANAAPLPQSTKEKIIDYYGEGLLHEMYGSTEAGIVTNMRPEFQLLKDTCVGTPFACTEVELRDDAGKLVPANVPGELFSRSPYLFNGYLGLPEATAETLQDGNWVSVGDIAVRDEQGFYYIVDRKKDMVISGGLNIYPGDVERVITRIPGVLECAVVGLPNAEWGERLAAFVVTADTAGDLDAETIETVCRANLASYKVPREMHFIQSLPRNANGKVLKKDLRASYAS